MNWSKIAVINAALGGWYPVGQRRLRRSLIETGFAGDILCWEDWPNDHFDKGCVYNVKASAFVEAISLGYEIILWIDCSGWAIKDITPIIKRVHDNGYFILSSKHNCAQTCSDRCLEHFRVSRDEAEHIPDSSTITFGIRRTNPIAESFLSKWIDSALAGAFFGNREHDPADSKDPRFLFHRQDQACASLAAHQSKMKLTDFGGLCAYDVPPMEGMGRSEETHLIYRGI